LDENSPKTNSSNSPNFNLLLQEEEICEEELKEDSKCIQTSDHLSNTKNYSINQESYELKPYNIWQSRE